MNTDVTTIQTPTPSIPSRATPTPAAPSAKPARKRKAKRKAKPRLPAAEVRKKRQVARNRSKIAKQIAKQMAVHTSPVKNPNRPLETKNQLQAVLVMANVLKKPELVIFSDVVQQFQKLSRGGRKRVIAALAQVYP